MNTEKNFDKRALISNWQQIQQQISVYLAKNNRANNATQLIAVSKTKPMEMISCLAEQGQEDFAENYLQEAIAKITSIQENYPQLQITWHYIGHIQRNKTRDIAENFAWVHTLERDIIGKRLNEQRPSHLPPLNVLIQVNIDEEESKSGCRIDEVENLVEKIITYPNLKLRGLMIIPAKLDKQNDNAFARTQELFNKIAKNYPQLANWDTLSMGMSGDMETAIKYGSTMVRIGTAIFGGR
ncbi:MAG: YggS family pyridoxal phosphate-dependent enzyme [Moraxellaceae bacterium]|nr:YggS family pyridoxal phosphate-dependent enzyme [Moraxellaceae bacterium]